MVLASCESAADQAYEGNEVLGFVSALMSRGTCGLVASTVAVPDAASVPFMRALHQRLRPGHRLADALFQARATLDVEDPHEFVNWCAFNAYGAA
jgi:CHAT domain-containing protein